MGCSFRISTARRLSTYLPWVHVNLSKAVLPVVLKNLPWDVHRFCHLANLEAKDALLEHAIGQNSFDELLDRPRQAQRVLLDGHGRGAPQSRRALSRA